MFTLLLFAQSHSYCAPLLDYFCQVILRIFLSAVVKQWIAESPRSPCKVRVCQTLIVTAYIQALSGRGMRLKLSRDKKHVKGLHIPPMNISLTTKHCFYLVFPPVLGYRESAPDVAFFQEILNESQRSMTVGVSIFSSVVA